MTYFQFLLLFLVLPILVLAEVWLKDRRQGKVLPAFLTGAPFWEVVGAHILLAVVYTTPWDNYLVASVVWFYEPSLVAGITLGWVPLEEYLFFVFQTILAGFWLSFLAMRLQPFAVENNQKVGFFANTSTHKSNIVLMLPGLFLWILGLLILLLKWRAGTYLGLILVWALPPILLQVGFGGDILWQNRRLALAGLFSMTLALSAADSLAIRAGTWTISPSQSTGILIAGTLPLEEFVFFAVTNTLLVFGILLGSAAASRSRINAILALLKGHQTLQPEERIS